MPTALTVIAAKYLFLLVIAGAGVNGFLLAKEERKKYLLYALLLTVIALIFTKLAGALYFDPRPFTHGVTPLFPHESDNGFPSDHTVLSVIAALMVWQYRKGVSILLFVLAIVVGVSRVASGVHSTLDIVAGVFIGIFSTAVASYVMEKLWTKYS